MSRWSLAPFAGLAGCLYIEPAWRPDVNQAPEILEPRGPAGTEFVHDLLASAYLTVIASDPDSTRIQCFWIVPGRPPPEAHCTVGEDGLISTHIELEPDPALDGELVEAHVHDVESKTEVVVLFRLVIGQPI